MRIALSCNNYPPEFRGGTERVVQALARGLHAAGDQVLVVCGSELPHQGVDVIEQHDGPIRVLRVPRLPTEVYGLDVERPRLLAVLERIWAENDIQVLHVHHWSHLSDGQLRAARAAGLGCLATLHDMWTSCARFFRLPPAGITCPAAAEREPCVACANIEYRETDAWVAERLAQRDHAIAGELAAAHFLFAPSSDCARACQHHRSWRGEPRDIEVLPHGLLDATPPGDRGLLGLPLRIGSFGNLHREKGVDLLLEAMAGVRAELHLFGSAPRELELELGRHAAQSGVRLTLHGPYAEGDPHPAAQLDLAVFPSLCRETYGLVVDEALHHGTPVVVSDSGALPERVSRGGGVVVPAGNRAALHETLRALVDDRDAYHALRASIPTELPTVDAAVSRYRHVYSLAFARAEARA
ncbi:MAG: glycosyltransferase [Planctomycetes bacterium]|nr:glycosyltransferase [Planctomycetota bacterium]MCB9870439.1 glycosyltransferase [Planctomycetota bacterium]